jgi:hypothetical protein
MIQNGRNLMYHVDLGETESLLSGCMIAISNSSVKSFCINMYFCK